MDISNIVFTPITRESCECILKGAQKNISEELSEILESLCELSSSADEVAVCLLPDALLVRVLDSGEYVFTSPIGLCDAWEAERALSVLADYTVREMIPLRLSDVMREEMEFIRDFFVSVDVESYPDDEDMFMVEVKNECMRLDEHPCISSERITLARITERELSAYARLCRDGDNNRYWGYDVREDNTGDTDDYFLDVAEREYDLGIALTLGVFYSGELVGEATLYAFDYRAGASLAVRIMREYQKMGFGGEAMSLLIDLGREIGLHVLRAEVMCENKASLAMTAKYMEEYKNDGERVYFKLEI